MTPNKVRQYKKMIAEFMVPNWEDLKQAGFAGTIPAEELYVVAALCIEDYDSLKYDSSFEWLMNACRKFDRLDPRTWTVDAQFEYAKLSDELDDCAALYDKMPLFIQLVKCVKWYNKNIK